MNSPNCTLIVLFGLFLYAPSSLSQTLECGEDDRECLEARFSMACGQIASGASLAESCLTWVEQVQEHSLAQHPEWKLIAGASYRLLADMAESGEARDRFRERSLSLYQEVTATYPGTRYASQAYLGLAGFSDDLDESIALLQEASRLDPENTAIPLILARWMEIKARATQRASDFGEAADMYRLAYATRGGWNTASNALQLYELADDSEQAEQFRSEVASDSGMSEFAEEVTSAEFATSPDRAQAVLGTACHSWIVATFGPEPCASGIDSLVAATRATASQVQRRAIVDVAVEAIRRLTVAQGLSEEDRSRFSEEFGQILREWINSGAATASVYVRWALHPESGLDESVIAMERALELEPDNGQYRYWLSMAYMAQRRFDEAIENLMIARHTLPENVGISTESVDARISEAEAERDRRQ